MDKSIKNLQDYKIREIPAEIIKAALLKANYDEDIFSNICSITNSLFEFINTMPKNDIVDVHYISAYNCMKQLYDFNLALLEELEKQPL